MANRNMFTRQELQPSICNMQIPIYSSSSQKAKMQNDINSCKLLLLNDSNSKSHASKAMTYTRKQATF